MPARRSVFSWPGRNLLAYVFGNGPQQTGGEPIAIAAVVVDDQGNQAGTAGNPSRVAGTLDQGAPGVQPWPVDASSSPVVVQQGTNPWGVAVADGANLDAFSRLRVGLPTLRFSALTDVGKPPLHFVESITGGGASSTYSTAAGTTTLTVSASGESVIRQTREYFAYRAGQGQLILVTFTLGVAAVGVTREVGYFDGADGLFLRQTATTVGVVARSSVSGSPVDTEVLQASWNLDRLDGTGASGITLDLSKSQILVIDFQALFVGRVRFGFDIDGRIVYVHELRNANVLAVPYIRHARLPIRYRIAGSVGILAPASMSAICCAVIREGGTAEPTVQREVSTGNAVAGMSTTPQTVLGIRLLAANNRATVRPIRLRVLNEDADPVRVRLVENPIVAGTPTWKAAGDDSAVEFSRSIGAVTVDADGDVASAGAIVLADVWLSGTGGGSSSDQGLVFDLGDVLPLSADVAGVADTLWIVCNMSTGTGNVRASLAFEEIR